MLFRAKKDEIHTKSNYLQEHFLVVPGCDYFFLK